MNIQFYMYHLEVYNTQYVLLSFCFAPIQPFYDATLFLFSGYQVCSYRCKTSKLQTSKTGEEVTKIDTSKTNYGITSIYMIDLLKVAHNSKMSAKLYYCCIMQKKSFF